MKAYSLQKAHSAIVVVVAVVVVSTSTVGRAEEVAELELQR